MVALALVIWRMYELSHRASRHDAAPQRAFEDGDAFKGRHAVVMAAVTGKSVAADGGKGVCLCACVCVRVRGMLCATATPPPPCPLYLHCITSTVSCSLTDSLTVSDCLTTFSRT